MSKPGDVLLRVDLTQTRSLSQMLRAQVDLSRAEEARLLTEREGGTAIKFPAELLERAKTDRELAENLSDSGASSMPGGKA